MVARPPADRDVRERVPRGGGACVAAPAPPAGPAHAALAAAAALGRPARRGRKLPTSRSCWRRPASACATCSTCPALREVMTDLRSRRTRLVAVDTERASPFAQSLLFRWVAVYMYEGDAPLAERRAAALTLDRDLLRELLGSEELRELLDPARSTRSSSSCSGSGRAAAPGRRTTCTTSSRARAISRTAEIAARVDGADARALDATGRSPTAARSASASPARSAWRRSRTPRGSATRSGCPSRSACPARSRARPTGRSRVWSRGTPAPTGRSLRPRSPLGWARRADRVQDALEALEASEDVMRGEFRPGGVEREWCDPDVLRRLRRRSLALLRREVEPVDAAALARFLPVWQGATRPRGDVDALADAIARLQGTSVPASILETDVLPARVRGVPARRPRRTRRRRRRGVGGRRSARHRRRSRHPRLSGPTRPRCSPSLRTTLRRARCTTRSASISPSEARRSGRTSSRPRGPPTSVCCSAALWDLVWAGEVTNDTLAPLRAFVRGASAKIRTRPAGPPAEAGCAPADRTAGRRRPVVARGGDSGSRRRPPPSARTRTRVSCSTATAW